jgi:hypothetical protein
VHTTQDVNRKIAVIFAAILLPGGFLALFGIVLVRALSQTSRGRKVVALAQKRVAAFREGGAPRFSERQVA